MNDDQAHQNLPTPAGQDEPLEGPMGALERLPEEGEVAAQQFAKEVAIFTDDEAKDFNIVRRPSSGYAQREEDARLRGQHGEVPKEARRQRPGEPSSSSSSRRPSGSKPPTSFWDPYAELPPARR